MNGYISNEHTLYSPVRNECGRLTRKEVAFNLAANINVAENNINEYKPSNKNCNLMGNNIAFEKGTVYKFYVS